MGSQAHVLVTGDPALLAVARSRIEGLERRWSRFISTSEVSRLNAVAGQNMTVSEETLRLVRRARDGWRETRGRFDPTVLGDVIRAGYNRPFEAVVIRASGGVSLLERNAGGIRLDARTRTVGLPPNTGFDPGGVGKGLAADIVVEELMAAGAAGACVNIGGDLRIEGEGPAAGAWIVEVEDPDGGAPIASLGIAGGGVATSTTRRRAWNVGGERRHHLIDPRTSRSLDRRAIAVTALSRDAAAAEIAAKHALLAPPGLEIVSLHELGCDGIVVGEDGSTERTNGLAAFGVARRVPA